jgi:uncharacterized protein (DUF697 family)/GTPase Era involved in 16S rRNA processing
MMREEILSGVKRLEELLDTLPIPLGSDLKDRLAELRQLLFETRAPRFVLVGRRGAGKSSLINALFGQHVADLGHVDVGTRKPRWFPYQSAMGAIEVLDTRGFQESGPSAEGSPPEAVVDSIVHACDLRPADAVLFLTKAKEVRAAVDVDVALLGDICTALHTRHGYHPPVIGIVTQCDELEPKNVRLHLPALEEASDLLEKEERVREAERILRAKLEEQARLRSQLVTVMGISAYMSWRADGSCRIDERWRVPELMRLLCSELPNEAQVEFARISRVQSIQKDIGHKLTMTVAAVCSGIAAVPIPLADIAPITSLQVMLVMGIGYISGRTLTMRSAAEMLAALGVNIGAAFALREAARALIKFVFPGGGNVISATVAFAGTVGIGKAAVAYFVDGVSAAEARQLYEDGREAGAQEALVP